MVRRVPPYPLERRALKEWRLKTKDFTKRDEISIPRERVDLLKLPYPDLDLWDRFMCMAMVRVIKI